MRLSMRQVKVVQAKEKAQVLAKNQGKKVQNREIKTKHKKQTRPKKLNLKNLDCKCQLKYRKKKKNRKSWKKRAEI